MPAFAATPPLQDRSVAEVLTAARAEGIVVVFNTQLVPESLRVLTEPAASSGLPMLTEVLAAHGLTLSNVAEGVYAVTRAAPPEPPPAPVVAPPVLEELVVTTSRFVLGVEPPGSHAVLSGEALQTLPKLGEETLKAVQRLPGVAGNGVAGLPAVRGGDPGETLILLDGLVLHEPFHLKNFLSPVSLLDSRFVAGLDFYSGGFGAAYGDRMSAVIDARSLQGPLDHQLELGVSLFHTNALAAGELAEGRSQWLVSLRQSNLGRVFPLLNGVEGNPEYSDGFARIDYRIDDDTRVALRLLASRDEVDLPWERAREQATAAYRNRYLWLTLERTWGPALSSELIASYSTIDNDRSGQVDDAGNVSGSVFDRRLFDVAGLTASFEWSPAWGLHHWGAEIKHLEADYRYLSRAVYDPQLLFPEVGGTTVVRDITVAPDGWQYAAFWSSRLSLAAAWALEAGVRLEDQAYTGPEHSVQANPRASLLYTPQPATHLRASWGQYSQSQRINELEVEDGIASFQPAQHSAHVVVSIDHQWSPALATRVEAYRKDYSRLKVRFENLLDTMLLLPELQPDRIRLAPSSARTYGVEGSLTWRPPGAWSGWFSYSWSEAADRIDGRAERRSWDQKHAVSTGLRWASGPWDVTLAGTWHSGWPTTAVALTTLPGPGGAVTTAEFGPRNGERLGSFQSLDLRISRRFFLPRGQLEAWFEIANATNHENPCCVDYRVVTPSGGNPQLVTETHDWLGVVPSFGVLWKY